MDYEKIAKHFAAGVAHQRFERRKDKMLLRFLKQAPNTLTAYEIKTMANESVDSDFSFQQEVNNILIEMNDRLR